MNADVVVVGAGPVGLATALGLARAGAPALVLDGAPALNTSPRAMAYLSPVMPAMENLGVLADVKTAGLVGNGVSFVDMQSGERFPQSRDVLQGYVPHPYDVHLGQDKLGNILINHLSAHPQTEIRWNHKVVDLVQDESHVTLRLETPEGPEVVQARWVIGADGASSAIRTALGLEFEGFTWPDRFVSTNIRYDFKKYGLDNANWRMDRKYGAIIARVDGGDLWRFTFRESADLPLDGLEDRIREHFVDALPGDDPYDLVQFAPYQMHQRCVRNFRNGRVILAGDAAHVTNPTGGLGLTGGLMDSAVLYEALAAVIHEQIDDSILDVYAERRRQVWADLVSPLASQLKQMVFDPPEGEQRTQMLAGLRALVDDPELSRADQLRQTALATPSILPEGIRVR